MSQLPDLKLTLKFEVEVLLKNISVDMNDVQQLIAQKKDKGNQRKLDALRSEVRPFGLFLGLFRPPGRGPDTPRPVPHPWPRGAAQFRLFVLLSAGLDHNPCNALGWTAVVQNEGENTACCWYLAATRDCRCGRKVASGVLILRRASWGIIMEQGTLCPFVPATHSGLSGHMHLGLI